MARLQRAFFTPGAANGPAANGPAANGPAANGPAANGSGAACPLKAGFFGLIFLGFFGFFFGFFDFFFAFFTPAPASSGRGLNKFLYF